MHYDSPVASSDGRSRWYCKTGYDQSQTETMVTSFPFPVLLNNLTLGTYFVVLNRGVIWGGWGAVAPQGKRQKKEKKEKREKKKKRKERKKGTMNTVNLLHIKCCYFPIFQ